MKEAVAGLTCYEAAPDATQDIADIQTDFEREFEQVGRPSQRLVLRALG